MALTREQWAEMAEDVEQSEKNLTIYIKKLEEHLVSGALNEQDKSDLKEVLRYYKHEPSSSYPIYRIAEETQPAFDRLEEKEWFKALEIDEDYTPIEDQIRKTGWYIHRVNPDTTQ